MDIKFNYYCGDVVRVSEGAWAIRGSADLTEKTTIEKFSYNEGYKINIPFAIVDWSLDEAMRLQKTCLDLTDEALPGLIAAYHEQHQKRAPICPSGSVKTPATKTIYTND